MSSDWTLEGELQKLTGTNSATAALLNLGLLESRDELFQLISPPRGWYRSGAETYLYPFRVSKDGSDVSLVLKACVAFSPGTPLQSILESWIDRRNVLASRGVVTPKLYAWGHGAILEEYVPHTLREALGRTPSNLERLLVSMADLAGVVANLRFQPVDLFEDLRSHGDDVVLIDCGQDLGPPFVSPEGAQGIFDQFVRYIGTLGMGVQLTLLPRLRRIFEAQSHTHH